MSDIIPNVVVSMPSQLFTLRRKFAAVSNGKVYISKLDMAPTIPENQIQVYLENEDGSHIPVAQPIIINQVGYPVYNGQIAKFVTVEGHSMVVYDCYGVQQFYFQNILKYGVSISNSENINLSGEFHGNRHAVTHGGGDVGSQVPIVTHNCHHKGHFTSLIEHACDLRSIMPNNCRRLKPDCGL